MTYQLCPKCRGQGVVSRQPGVPHDVGYTAEISVGPWTCDVCHGEKVLRVDVEVSYERAGDAHEVNDAFDEAKTCKLAEELARFLDEGDPKTAVKPRRTETEAEAMMAALDPTDLRLNEKVGNWAWVTAVTHKVLDQLLTVTVRCRDGSELTLQQRPPSGYWTISTRVPDGR